MKHYFQNYKFLRTELKILLYISITLILIIEFIGFSYHEIFPKTNIIANIFLKICYSYVSALIFYYLIVHYKRQDEKRKFYTVLDTKLNSLILDHDRIYSNISKLNNNKVIDTHNKENLKNSLKNVNPHNIYDGIMYINVGKVDWLKHLHIVAENSKNEIEKIYLQSFLLEVELIKILDNLNNNSLFQQVRLIVHASISNQDFEAFFEAFYDYSNVIEILKEYKKKEIQKYII
ncbi:MAG: hypothetical protein J5I52_00225 [Saprospiraceae bacterium]|nr:hypothetical protein [Saprospiraceae bacterium]MCZ2338209.1 hypothetical protein [Chitinophagales bacterium]